MFLVVYEIESDGPQRQFRARPKTHADVDEAQEAASDWAQKSKSHCWVVEFHPPSVTLPEAGVEYLDLQMPLKLN